MRILLLTQVLPFPPDSGPKIKTFHVLRYLAERHDVHLVSFIRSTPERAAAKELRRWCASVDTVELRRSRLLDVLALTTALLRRRSFLVQRDESAAMRACIARVLDRFPCDAVHADQLTMGQFAVNLPMRQRVLDEHNAVWTIVRRAASQEPWGPRRLLAEIEWRRLKLYEGRLAEAFDQVLVVSPDDRRDLESAAGSRLAATIVPIAIDTEELRYAPPNPAARHVLSLATMFYPPNVEGVEWFARRVFPSVHLAAPTTRLRVVGSRPPARIRRLATPTSGIEVTGYVADLTPYLQDSAMLVVPLHAGSGMRVKILEAFARGMPVVSTALGVEGIAARDGEHLLVADSPTDFGSAVLNVLSDPTSAARRASAARRLVEERYDHRRALRALDQVYPLGRAAESFASPVRA